MAAKVPRFPDHPAAVDLFEEFRHKAFGGQEAVESAWWKWAADSGLLGSADNLDRALDAARNA